MSDKKQLKKVKKILNNESDSDSDKPLKKVKKLCQEKEKPKRPLNAYQQYIKDNYQRVKSKMLGGSSKDIISTLAFEYKYSRK